MNCFYFILFLYLLNLCDAGLNLCSRTKTICIKASEGRPCVECSAFHTTIGSAVGGGIDATGGWTIYLVAGGRGKENLAVHKETLVINSKHGIMTSYNRIEPYPGHHIIWKQNSDSGTGIVYLLSSKYWTIGGGASGYLSFQKNPDYTLTRMVKIVSCSHITLTKFTLETVNQDIEKGVYIIFQADGGDLSENIKVTHLTFVAHPTYRLQHCIYLLSSSSKPMSAPTPRFTISYNSIPSSINGLFIGKIVGYGLIENNYFYLHKHSTSTKMINYDVDTNIALPLLIRNNIFEADDTGAANTLPDSPLFFDSLSHPNSNAGPLIVNNLMIVNDRTGTRRGATSEYKLFARIQVGQINPDASFVISNNVLVSKYDVRIVESNMNCSDGKASYNTNAAEESRAVGVCDAGSPAVVGNNFGEDVKFYGRGEKPYPYYQIVQLSTNMKGGGSVGLDLAPTDYLGRARDATNTARGPFDLFCGEGDDGLCNYPYGFCEGSGVCNCTKYPIAGWSKVHGDWWTSGPKCQCNVSLGTRWNSDINACECDKNEMWEKEEGGGTDCVCRKYSVAVSIGPWGACKCDESKGFVKKRSETESWCACKSEKPVLYEGEDLFCYACDGEVTKLDDADASDKKCVCDAKGGWTFDKKTKESVGTKDQCRCDENKGFVEKEGKCKCDESKGLIASEDNVEGECKCDSEKGLMFSNTIDEKEEDGKEKTFCTCKHGKFLNGLCVCNEGYERETEYECARSVVGDLGKVPASYSQAEGVVLMVFAGGIVLCLVAFGLTCVGVVAVMICQAVWCTKRRKKRKIIPLDFVEEMELKEKRKKKKKDQGISKAGEEQKYRRIESSEKLAGVPQY